MGVVVAEARELMSDQPYLVSRCVRCRTALAYTLSFGGGWHDRHGGRLCRVSGVLGEHEPDIEHAMRVELNH